MKKKIEVDEYNQFRNHEYKVAYKDTEYTAQAKNFLWNNNLKLNITFLTYGKHFANDTSKRNIYAFVLENKKTREQYIGRFGDSVYNTEKCIKPTFYDILACLNIEEFKDVHDFSEALGYDMNNKNTLKIYKAVMEETEGLKRVLTPKMIEQLHEIN